MAFLLAKERHKNSLHEVILSYPCDPSKICGCYFLFFFNLSKIIVNQSMLQAMYDCLNNLCCLGKDYIS